MAMKSELVEELRIDDSEFVRVRHIWRGYESSAAKAPAGTRAWCGCVKLRTGRSAKKVSEAPGEFCVVCLELRGHLRV